MVQKQAPTIDNMTQGGYAIAKALSPKALARPMATCQ